MWLKEEEENPTPSPPPRPQFEPRVRKLYMLGIQGILATKGSLFELKSG